MNTKEKTLARWSFPSSENTAILMLVGPHKAAALDYENVMEMADFMRRQAERRDGAIWFPEI